MWVGIKSVGKGGSGDVKLLIDSEKKRELLKMVFRVNSSDDCNKDKARPTLAGRDL